ncbi:MAG: type II restriction endonuclease, partial [Bacteroidaceae bacterium]|nr:type II restriction endonuclease [Bacteroidaceae bacterium]
VLDILIAVRTRDNKKAVDNNGEIHTISSFFETVEGVITYIKETGLQEVFRQKQVKNLVDYVFGVEVGLDTNARKNRSGDIMETIVAGVFKKNGIRYRKEIYSTEFPEIEKALGEDKKCFDFVIETTCKTYLFEVNFYNSNGSKPNEVARAYTELAPKINACKGYEFVWITDGKGWSSAKKMLAEAFYAIPSVYNLTTINEFIAEIKSKK